MNYQEADIHTRINTKANTIIYYRRNPNKHLIARLRHRDTDIAYSHEGMMLKHPVYSEPRNAGNPKY